MCRYNRRKHDRLALRLNVLWHRAGGERANVFSGRTVNVSTGGVCFESGHCEIRENDIVNLELSVPPTDGALEFGGRLGTMARVVRVDEAKGMMPLESGAMPKIAVAAEFIGLPKFCV
jgi:hypothetical protein